MKKLILILILALGAALALPATRPRVLKLLEPVTKPVIDPVLSWSAEGEMDRLARALVEVEETYRQMPDAREFGSWLRSRYQGGGAEWDPWGSRYYLKVWADSFVVGSPGPDRQAGTADDLMVSRKRRGARR